MFAVVDKDTDGSINRRELIIALRKNADICELLKLPGKIRCVGCSSLAVGETVIGWHPPLYLY